jgi:hypothetical protein
VDARVVVYTSGQEAEAGGLWIQGQLGVQGKSLSPTKEREHAQ